MTDILSVTGFTGEYRDPVSGHYHLGNGYRVYNPVLMRFMSPDSLSPFGPGGINPYVYCAGDPINNTDPSGHMSKGLKIGIGIGVAIGTIALGVITGGTSLAAEGAIAGTVAALDTGVEVATETGEMLGNIVLDGAEGSGELIVDTTEEIASGSAQGANNVQYGVEVDVPENTRFSQETVHFDNNSSLEEWRHALLDNESSPFPPIDTVEMSSNNYVTLDNRRLYVSRRENRSIKAIIHRHDDLLPEDMKGRFGGSKTWGEAVNYRISDQREIKFLNDFLNGGNPPTRAIFKDDVTFKKFWKTWEKY
ncbi:RHS repeat-associated core domain [Serratia plymuthica]|nr:RHS repeat-associated core domain [Serratia plymuthica]